MNHLLKHYAQIIDLKSIRTRNPLFEVVLGFFSGYSIKRNQRAVALPDALLIYVLNRSALVLLLLVLQYGFIMIKAMAFGAALYCLFYTIGTANKTRYYAVFDIVVGSASLFLKPNIAFTVFGYHREAYLYCLLIGIGVSTLILRLLNAGIWAMLDAIALQHLKGQKPDTFLYQEEAIDRALARLNPEHLIALCSAHEVQPVNAPAPLVIPSLPRFLRAKNSSNHALTSSKLESTWLGLSGEKIK